MYFYEIRDFKPLSPSMIPFLPNLQLSFITGWLPPHPSNNSKYLVWWSVKIWYKDYISVLLE